MNTVKFKNLAKFNELPPLFEKMLGKSNCKGNPINKDFFAKCYLDPENWKKCKSSGLFTKSTINHILKQDFVPNIIKYYITNDNKYICNVNYENINNYYNQDLLLLVAKDLDVTDYVNLAGVCKHYRVVLDKHKNLHFLGQLFALTHVTKKCVLYNLPKESLEYICKKDDIVLFQQFNREVGYTTKNYNIITYQTINTIINYNAINIIKLKIVRGRLCYEHFVNACMSNKKDIINFMVNDLTKYLLKNIDQIVENFYRVINDNNRVYIIKSLERLYAKNTIDYVYGYFYNGLIDENLINQIVKIKLKNIGLG